MAVTPPLDRLTVLPAQGVDFIQQQLNRLLDLILAEMKQVIQEVSKLPNGIDCDDPRVQQVKDTLQSIQDKLQQLKEELPKIQQIISQVQTIVRTGLAIKNTIAAAQLLNPVTAPLFIANVAQQLQTGDRIRVDFKSVCFLITEKKHDCLIALVERGGFVGSNKAADTSSDIELDPVTTKDKEAFKIGLKMGVKNFSLSF